MLKTIKDQYKVYKSFAVLPESRVLASSLDAF